MPSGSFLTAIFNSIVNKYYTAMWYYRNMMKKGVKPTVTGFWEHVIDYVYGDDKVNGVREHLDVLNAVTMRDFFESCGMTFTDSKKNQIVGPTQQMSEITFLKRSFVYHNLLDKIVCPLDLKTLQSGLSYVDYTKDVQSVMNDKIANYQREIFLHDDRVELLREFKARLAARGWAPKVLEHSYLMYLYTKMEWSLPSYTRVYE